MSIVTTRRLGLAAALALFACSGSKPASELGSNATDATANASAGHAIAGMGMPSTGDPDADFLRDMIPHHEGAVEMAQAELTNGTDPKVRAMAEEVIRTQ